MIAIVKLDAFVVPDLGTHEVENRDELSRGIEVSSANHRSIISWQETPQMRTVLGPGASEQLAGKGGMAAFKEVRTVIGNGLSIEKHKPRERFYVIVGDISFRATPDRKYVTGKRITMTFVDSLDWHAHSEIGHGRDLV